MLMSERDKRGYALPDNAIRRAIQIANAYNISVDVVASQSGRCYPCSRNELEQGLGLQYFRTIGTYTKE